MPDQAPAPETPVVPYEQIPTNVLARTARKLNRSFPRSYAVATMTPRLVAAYAWLRRLEKAGAGQRLSALPFDEVRTSDTVFVLGTGASINRFPEDWWKVIRRHDSIGMNFFLLHEHVPTFHVMENAGQERRKLLEIRYARRQDYAGVPLIMKTQLSNLSLRRVGTRFDDLMALHPAVRANTYFSVDFLAPGTTVSEAAASYQHLRQLGFWTPKPRFTMLSKRRGSVTYIINLAVRAGYRRIVLCGVDLNHTEYFYDSRREELEAAGLPVPINDEIGQVHSTNDPANHPVTVSDVILAIKEVALDPAGVDLLVAADTSALHPALSLFDWQNAA